MLPLIVALPRPNGNQEYRMNNYVVFSNQEEISLFAQLGEKVRDFPCIGMLCECSCRRGFGRIKAEPDVFGIQYALLLISGQIE